MKGLKKSSALAFFLIITFRLLASELYQTNIELNIRKGAGTRYHSIGMIPKGDTIQAIDTNSAWYKIKYQEKEGYVYSKFLIPISLPVSVIEPSEEHSHSGLVYVILLLSIVAFIIIISNRSKSQSKPYADLSNLQPNIKSGIENFSEEIIRKTDSESIISPISTSTNVINLSSRSIPTSYKEDKSIIDVTGDTFVIPKEINGIVLTKINVPYWEHTYVYSYSEIKNATKEQRIFYDDFKRNFISGVYYDLDGNLNYAFILLFDFLNEFDQRRDIDRLEKQVKILGKCYPKTESYGISFLQEKGRTIGKIISNPNSNDWLLGNKYKSQLKLTDREVDLLNTLIDTNNQFNSEEGIVIDLIRMFLDSVNELDDIFKASGSNFIKQADIFAEIAIKNDFRYKNFRYNESVKNTFINDVYQCIYKTCENKLRDLFNVGRKTDLYWYLHSQEAILDFNSRFQIHLDKITQKLIGDLIPTEQHEILLNRHNKSRWRIKIQELEQSFSGANKSNYILGIYNLAAANVENPNIENIFYQASKFIAPFDPIESLKFYIHYLHYDLNSIKIDNKQLTKTIQKTLFKTSNQLRDFESIVSDLINNKNLDDALQKVSQLYSPKRKRIELDTLSIEQVQKQDQDTVQLLNKYLEDEHEEVGNTINIKEINADEIKFEINQKEEKLSSQLTYKKDISFNPIQINILNLFLKNNFSLSRQDIESFAKSNGVFANQLIESINEICYDEIDDILIEEDGDQYILHDNYYQKLLTT